MNAEIDLGTFQYRDYFPDSKKVDLFERLQREKYPDRLYPFLMTLRTSGMSVKRQLEKQLSKRG